MLYTKPIEDISFQDVIDFCNEGRRESIYLDYKQDIDKKTLAKTIASMANTWGGIIIVGVEEDDSKPALPVVGLPYKEHIPEQIHNILISNITPPVFPEVHVCTNDDKGKMFVVIRIAQSNITPHAIKANTKVYVRTQVSNEPVDEELANLERISWLSERRSKSLDMKEKFFDVAHERYLRCCSRETKSSFVNGQGLLYAEGTMGITPAFPYEKLVEATELRNNVVNEISTTGWGGFKVPSKNWDYSSVNEGVYSFTHNWKNFGVEYVELNEFGFYTIKYGMGHIPEGGSLPTCCSFYTLLREIDLFLESSKKLYKKLGYWGILEFRFHLGKIGAEVIFETFERPSSQPIPIDTDISFVREFTTMELIDETPEKKDAILIGLFLDVSWALGYPQLTKERIEQVLKGWGGRQ